MKEKKKSLNKWVWSKQEQTQNDDHRRQICCRHTKPPRDKPPPQTYEHPVSIMCKNKALRIQWPEISVECVSADALRCVCGVIRNSWWPMKKTAGGSPRPPPHGRESTWPAWLRFGPLWGKSCATKSRAERKSEESIEVGYEGDLLTRHHLNAFRLETERRYLFRGLSSVSLSFTPHQSKFIPSFSFLD